MLMQSTVPLYGQSLASLTDMYQFSMGQGYFKEGMHEWDAVFHLFFRRLPFNGGFALAGGLASIVDLLQNFRFTPAVLTALAAINGNDGRPIFCDPYLDYLSSMKLRLTIDAVPEGTAVFPHEPLVRVSGPLIQGQLVESAFLNFVNPGTLWTTQAARMVLAADGSPIFDGGLRRAQGADGAISAARYGYMGGFAGTSNVLAGTLFGIPLKGTMAHAYIMAHDTEYAALLAYARHLPNNCVFLVDTYDTLEGVRNAVKVGQWMKELGHKMIGIRLDSGDLAYLSIEARKILDEAGFKDAIIVASNDLDEHLISSLRQQGARIDSWLVGTKFITCYGCPALGGVYKLAAIRKPGREWEMRIKIGSDPVKTSIPGILDFFRYTGEDGLFAGDEIVDVSAGDPAPSFRMVHPSDDTRMKKCDPKCGAVRVLQRIFEEGRLVQDLPSLESSRVVAKAQLDALHPGIKRILNPHEYPAGLSPALAAKRRQLILAARGA